MADNVPITAGAGTAIATDDIGDVHYQITKLGFGALNAVTLVSGADPLPISGAVTVSGTVPVSGTFWQTTQPVSVDALPLPTGAATAAKQDTIIGHVDGIEALLAGTLNVAGTFWQATQPVSGTVTANIGTIAGVASETTLAALNTKTPALGQATMASSAPVVIASNQSALSVTGTFWQATQPVSGTVTANAGSGTFAISAAALPLPSGAATSAKQPALGTAGSAATDVVTVQGIASMVALKVDGSAVTQPVSIAALPALAAGSNNIGDVDVLTLPALVAGSALIGKVGIDQTTPGTTNAVSLSLVGANAILTGNGVTGTGSQRVTIASDNAPITVNSTPPTLTKGAQGATGLSTQDLKDAGRAIVNAATAIAGITAVTTEALVALNVSRDGAATASLTTIPVTSGKRLRITHVVVGLISTAAAVLSGRFSLRMNPSGAVTASSPIIATLPVPSGAALAQAGGSLCMTVPDGIEFSGTMQIGLSQVCSVTTGTIWASLIGFEY